MTNEIERITQRNELAPLMEQAGKAANAAAAAHVFQEHTERKSYNTIRRKLADLALFETFLQSAGIPAADLATHPAAWTGITWGLVEAYKQWQLKQGYAIPSINGHLSTVRVYAELAAKAGAIEPQEAILINAVKGYARKEIKHLDAQRESAGVDIRTGAKKAEPTPIHADMAAELKQQPDTQQGQRDALLMCLLLDHGLRIGEAALLEKRNFDLKAGILTFYRPKVDKLQTHELTPDTRKAAKAYLEHAPGSGIIWRKSSKSGTLSGTMTSAVRALAKRVNSLGYNVGLYDLSPHDCRHYWATFEARNKTPIDRLQDAGGWTSPAMPLRYIESAHIANEGTAHIKSK